jgi:hypothetical protein
MDENNGVQKGTARNLKQSARRTGGRKALNLFDMIVIALVIVAIALLVTGMHVGNLFGGNEGESVNLTYTLVLRDVEEAYANAIRQGDEIYDVNTRTVVGTVTQTPAVTLHTEIALQRAEDGTVKAVETIVPGRVDITVTVLGQAEHREGEGYYVGNQSIRVGAFYTVRFPDYLGSAQCTGFDGATKVKD